MSKIKNDGLDQYDAEPFEQQQFGTAGVEWVILVIRTTNHVSLRYRQLRRIAQMMTEMNVTITTVL